MLTSDIEPVCNRKPVGIYWAFGCLGVILYLMIVYSWQLGSEVAGQQAVLVDAVKEMRYEITHANLLLERGSNTEISNSQTELYHSRERSDELCHVILEGGFYGGVHVQVVRDGELQGRLQNVKQLQSNFYDLLEDIQLRQQAESAIRKDPRYSVMAASRHELLNTALDGVEKRLKAVIGRKHATFRATQIGLLLLFLVCAIGAAWMMWGFVDKLENQNRRVLESESRTRLLFENAKDMIFLVDLVTAEVMDANVEACNLLGYERSDLLGKSLREVEPRGELKQFEKSSFSIPCCRSYRIETEFVTKSGGALPVEVNLGYVEVRNRTCLLGVVRDFSERKKMESELIEAKQRAEAVNRIKSEFMNNMNHEIRTPINGVMGVLQLLQTTSLCDEQLEYVDMGLQSCTLLTNLIANILELSEMDSKSVALQAKPFVLMEAIAAVGADYAEKIARQGLHYRVDFDERIPEELVGDPKRLQQILTSLVDNAVKFTEAGEIVMTVSLVNQTRSATNEPYKIRFEVLDSGPGISELKLETIFEPFEQGDGSSTRRFQGAGLGLSVAKKLIDQMRGSLFAESVEAGGSRFVVELPLLGIRQGEDSEACKPEVSNRTESVLDASRNVESGDYRRADLSEILGKLNMKIEEKPSTNDFDRIPEKNTLHRVEKTEANGKIRVIG